MNYIYGYARVSADDQNLATQLDTLEKHGCHRIFQEKINGSYTSRPMLDKLLEVLRPGDTVTVARFFRLGRNAKHLLELLDHFTAHEIKFVALDMGVDSTTPAGRLVMTNFAGLAQYFKEDLAEKTAHGRELATQRGVHMGRRKGPNEKNLARVKTCLAASMSVSQIVEATGIPLASVKRYRKILEAISYQEPGKFRP